MLKFWYFLIVYLFLFAGLTTAQVRVGFSAGFNSTGLSGDSPQDGSYVSDYGYQLGGTAVFYFYEDIAINVQSLYSHKSSLVQFDVNYQYDPYDSLSVRSEYFEIPLSIKVISNNKISYVTAGISLGILMESKARNNRTANERIISDSFENYIWSANFGVGVQFPIGKPLLCIELNYNQTLTNLTNRNVEELSSINKLKSNSIYLSAGLLFTLQE